MRVQTFVAFLGLTGSFLNVGVANAKAEIEVLQSMRSDMIPALFGRQVGGGPGAPCTCGTCTPSAEGEDCCETGDTVSCCNVNDDGGLTCACCVGTSCGCAGCAWGC